MKKVMLVQFCLTALLGLVLAGPCRGQLPTLVKDIRPGSSGSIPRALTNVNGTLYFRAGDDTNGRELWKSDGTAASTVLVKDIRPGPNNSDLDFLTNVNGTLYFSAYDGTTGNELWKSDGTAAGTVLAKDIRPGSNGSFPEALVNFNGTLYFSAYDDTNGKELWKSDGTAAGTVLVKDINPGPDGSDPGELFTINGTLYFSAYDNTNGRELWKSDGTAAGTVLIKDINPGPDYSSFDKPTNVNGTLYFTTDDGTSGIELWKSNGTAAGTVLVRDINPGSGGSNPTTLTNVNGTLYFTTDDGTNGDELWKSDGTETGTVLVRDINPGPDGSGPDNLVNFNGTLYFAADGGTNGDELWKSDGTEAGTVLVKDVWPGPDGSLPRDLINFNGTLYFSAYDGTNGNELWKSDGTEAGTVLVGDIWPGPDSSLPYLLTNINGTLYFTADDGPTGQELWKLGAPFVSVPLVSGAPVCAGQAVTLTFTSGASGPLTAQLSDASGSFANPRSLGAVSPGSQSVTIPAGVLSGSGYRIRVVSANDGPSSEPSAAFSVTGLVGNYTSTPTVSLTPACAGGSIRVSFTVGSRGTCSFPQNNTFTAQLSEAGGSFTSPVNLGTVTPGINTVALPQNLPTGSGYRVRITASADAEVLLTSPSAVFTVNQPAFSGTPSVSGDNKCAGQGVRLSFSGSSCAFFGGNVFSVELSDASGANFASIPGTVTPGALNTVVIPTGTPAGTGYKLRVVSSNPALTSAASANFKVKACGNSREAAPEEAGLRVVVSPNPATEGPLKISIIGAEGQALQVALFNGVGQPLREQVIGRAGEEEVLDWNLGHQPQGLYLLRVSGERESKTLKVLH